MDKMMRKNWWKILGVLLVVYGIVAGLLVPLKPNVWQLSPRSAQLGELNTFELVGYNTRFLGADAGAVNVFLKARSGEILSASNVQIIDDRKLNVSFQIPDYLPDPTIAANTSITYQLIVTTPNDGYFVDPAGITLRQQETPPSKAAATAGWRTTGLTKDDLFVSDAVTFPYRGLLGETIRNTYFHVSLWFAMIFIFIAGVTYAILYLIRSKKASYDGLATVSLRDKADFWMVAFTSVGMLFGVLGLTTGAVWAKYTWGSYWSWDIKQFTTLVALLIYAGFFALRAALPDTEQKARLSSAYNIFAFVCLIPLIYIIPRLTPGSLHPGATGNPAMGGEDLDGTMRMVFYPIIIGWTLFGFWMAGVRYRIGVLGERLARREE